MSKIIIGGVDISNCPYCLNNKLKRKTHSPAKSMPYAKETSCIACKTEVTKYNFCKHNPNCHYKQLQQYKQLCEQKTVDNFDLMRQIDELKANKKKLEQFLENILEMAKYNYKNTCLSCLHNCERCVENDKCGRKNPFTRLDFIREMIEEFRI